MVRVPANPSDVESIDSILKALYESVSFPPGGEADWDRFRSLFIPGGRLIPPRSENNPGLSVMDVEEFIAWCPRFLEETGIGPRGLYERDASRTVEVFGNVAQVFSTYVSRYTAADERPFQRGINSIQLVRDEGGWRMAMIAWDFESAGKPIPSKYLPKS